MKRKIKKNSNILISIVAILLAVIVYCFFSITYMGEIVSPTEFVKGADDVDIDIFKGEINGYEVERDELLSVTDDAWINVETVPNSRAYDYLEITVSEVTPIQSSASIYYKESQSESYSEERRLQVTLREGKNYIKTSGLAFDALRLDLTSQTGVYISIDSVKLLGAKSHIDIIGLESIVLPEGVAYFILCVVGILFTMLIVFYKGKIIILLKKLPSKYRRPKFIICYFVFQGTLLTVLLFYFEIISRINNSVVSQQYTGQHLTEVLSALYTMLFFFISSIICTLYYVFLEILKKNNMNNQEEKRKKYRGIERVVDEHELMCKVIFFGLFLVIFLSLVTCFHIYVVQYLGIIHGETVEVNNKFLLMLLEGFVVLLFTILVMHLVFDKMKTKKGEALIIISIYSIMLLFFVLKADFYEENVRRFPDEEWHIAYTIYLHESDNVIPQFKEIGGVSIIDDNGDTMIVELNPSQTNYLCHPPLYYHILSRTNAIQVSNEQYSVNVEQLRSISLIMSAIALIIAFYIGYRALKHIPILHMLYAFIITTVPMNAYLAKSVNNDNLAFLGMMILLLAIVRFYSAKRNMLTYLLISIAVATIMLTKLTAGVVAVIVILFILIHTWVREKSFLFLLNKKFFMTLPIYLIVLGYFLAIFMEYGQIQTDFETLNPELFSKSGFYVAETDRIVIGLWEGFQVFIKGFITTWTGIASHVVIVKPAEEAVWGIASIGFSLILFFPLVSVFIKIRSSLKIPLLGFLVGLYIAFLIQFYNAYNAPRGPFAAFQSRYYLCILPALALLICLIFQHFSTELKKSYLVGLKYSVFILIFSICTLLLYGDFVYFLLNFSMYI